MLNPQHTQALALAVLITALLHGSMLWKLDEMATDGAARQAQAGKPAAPGGKRAIMLDRVIIIGGLAASPLEQGPYQKT